ncbi:MAG: rhodanese-like domain-containing protein [Magnetovibrionaceae bacterium]
MIKLTALLLAFLIPALAVATEDVPWPKNNGYRMTLYGAPVPASVPGGIPVDAAEAKVLIDAGKAIPIDVIPSAPHLTEDLEGGWLVYHERRNIPGSLWWPDIGKGALTEAQADFFAAQLAALPEDKAPLFYCIRNCWMSWNAVKRAARKGRKTIYWLADGTDGWAEAGFPLEPGKPQGRAWPSLGDN